MFYNHHNYTKEGPLFVREEPTHRIAWLRPCPHIRGGLYRGVSSRHAGVAFIEGCPHVDVRGGLYRGVSSCQGCPL